MEKIEVGDKVYSRNRATGDTELRPVIALTPPHRDKLLELRIEGEGTALRPSLDHPFWVRRSTTDTGHWIIAANLVSGELLETMEGSWRKIDSVAPVEGKETVYNLPSTRITTTSSGKLVSWFTMRTATADQAIFNMSSSTRLSSVCREIGTIKMPRCLNKLLKAL